jgi:AcrR family transcriptional regulator
VVDGQTGTAPRPLRRDAERNRARVLAAAREVFRHRGFDATLDDIAAHAGLGVATVHRRFPDKDHLVEAMFVQRLHDIRALAEQAMAEPDPWESLVGFLVRAAELVADDRGVREVLLSSALGRDEVRQARDRLAAVTVRLLQRVRGEGALDSGLLMAPQGLGAMLAMPIAGQLADRTGVGRIVPVGLAIIAGSSWWTRPAARAQARAGRRRRRRRAAGDAALSRRRCRSVRKATFPTLCPESGFPDADGQCT